MNCLCVYLYCKLVLQEEAAAKAVSGVPPAPATADSIDSERSLSKFQLFVPCTAEDVTNGSMEGVSDPQPSPENLRQHQEDQSSLDISDNEDVVREDATEPTLVLFEDKNTAYEETLSPGLDSNNTDVESGSGLLTTLFVCIFSRLAQASVQALYNVLISPVVLGPGVWGYSRRRRNKQRS